MTDQLLDDRTKVFTVWGEPKVKARRRLRGESQKNIVNLMDSICGRYSRWEIWQDFIIMAAISISNVFNGPHRKSRERTYLERAGKYTRDELAVFPALLTEVVAEMDRDPDQDFLGELFMALGLGNEWKGQFFTPYDVCRAMSAMTFGNDPAEKIQREGWTSVNDPACGAGALLIAFANECRRNGINYQTSVLFVAQDIDYLAGMMCYIQLSLLGCPGYVVIDDTILHPSVSYDRRGLIPKDGSNVWYTPMYYRNIWHWRRIWAQVDIQCQRAITLSPEPSAAADEPTEMPTYNVTKAGQLSLF